jgi:hypothetical protein
MSWRSRFTRPLQARPNPCRSGNRLLVEALEDRLSPAVLTVNSTQDTANPTDPYLSLRQAIALVNSPTLPTGLSDQILGQIDGRLHDGRTDTIVFDSAGVSGPIVLGGTQLELSLPGSTASVTIDGGDGVTVDGSGRSRVLQVDSRVQATLDHLTLTHGSVPDSEFGAGILNAGSLTVSLCTLSANSTYYGAGIANNSGTLTVSHSTLTANSGGSGGAIRNSGGRVTLSNSTLSANSTVNYGGAITTFDGTLTVSNCTLSANSTGLQGGGIYTSGGTLWLQNTIVAGNRAINNGPDIVGSVQSSSRSNLVGIGDGGLTGISNGIGGNLIGSTADPIDPRLGPLADNGGPTLTHALLADSPARGAGSLDFATPTDQRGLPRSVDGQIDLGAYQTQDAVAGPRVAVSDPGGVLDPPVDHVRLTFNHPMDPSGLTTAGVHLSGPSGIIQLTAVTAVLSTNDQQFELSFAVQTQPGDYALVLDPGVRDAYGHPPDDRAAPLFILAGLPGCILTVNSSADTANSTDPYLTLREAIALINGRALPEGLSPQILEQISGPLHRHGSDRIVFDPTQVSGPILLGGTQLELTLPGGVAQVTIDGSGWVALDGGGRSRVLQVDSGVRVTLDRLTITHASISGYGYGAGIYSQGALTVTDSTISSNTTYQGGGIYNDHGTLTVSNSTLSGNSASFGGGIYTAGGTVTVSNSTFSANDAYDGGGIYNTLGTMTVSNSTLSANSASYLCGGIYNDRGALTVNDSALVANSGGNCGGIYNASGTLTVSNSTLSANSGGGISNGSGTATVSDSTLSANSAFYGGGIANSAATLTVRNCTFAANSAVSGGGIYNYSGLVTLSNCTLSANTATYRGGGIYISADTPRLQNTLVAGNRAFNLGPDIDGAVDSASGYNLVGNGTDLSGIRDGVNRNQIGTSANPIDARLSSLGYYGGPTQTYALRPGSPAQAAGDPAVTGTDQRGQPRLPGSSDIGAFQTQPDPFVVTTLEDPGRQSGVLSLREAVALANVLPGDASVSFADALDGGAVRLTTGELELSGTGGVTTIDGSGRFTLDGANRTRLVQVDPGTTAALRGLALVNGNAPVGAGVYNRGSLTVSDCVLYGNTAYSGGAILNQGNLTVYGSTLAFNVATLGPAIDNEGYLVAYNATLLYNAALRSGGAILNQPTGTALLTSLTISRNSADQGGGLDVLPGSVALLRNSIVAGNSSADASAASDITGTVDSSSRYNLIGTGGSGGLLDGQSHNLVGVADPGLTTPDFSSSQTPAFGFTADSPALGAGDPSLLDDPLLSRDQHGNLRTVVNVGAI